MRHDGFGVNIFKKERERDKWSPEDKKDGNK
jgi:hypothetical protein